MPLPIQRDEETGMLQMSIWEHLEELRALILRALYGFAAVFLGCMLFCNPLFDIVLAPGRQALKATGIHGADFIALDPFEKFSIIWVWTPLVAAIFLGAPWILYQLWAFLAPGLYQREKKWAVPFVLSTAGLFVTGGLFGYFVAFPYAMTFLLGIGGPGGVVPLISIDLYFERFVDMMLGIGVAFELPVLIFFLTLIRVASPSFLLKHSDYAILAITILAAVVTPSPDFLNMMLFAVPMWLLFFVGVFASYLLVLKREDRRFPWKALMIWLAAVALVLAGGAGILVLEFHAHFVRHWPFLVGPAF
jgi:sec-independent protein translocase protein TatC